MDVYSLIKILLLIKVHNYLKLNKYHTTVLVKVLN